MLEGLLHGKMEQRPKVQIHYPTDNNIVTYVDPDGQEPALHGIGEVQSIGILTQPVRRDLVGENGNIEEEIHCAVPTILKRKQSRDQEKDLALGLGVTTCTPLPQQNTSSLAQKRDFCTFIREKKG